MHTSCRRKLRDTSCACRVCNFCNNCNACSACGGAAEPRIISGPAQPHSILQSCLDEPAKLLGMHVSDAFWLPRFGKSDYRSLRLNAVGQQVRADLQIESKSNPTRNHDPTGESAANQERLFGLQTSTSNLKPRHCSFKVVQVLLHLRRLLSHFRERLLIL